MLALGDDNAERGYQQIIDTYREAKQWQTGHGCRQRSYRRNCRTTADLKMVYAAQLADMGQTGRGACRLVKSC